MGSLTVYVHMKALASPALQGRKIDDEGKHRGLKIKVKTNEWDKERKKERKTRDHNNSIPINATGFISNN